MHIYRLLTKPIIAYIGECDFTTDFHQINNNMISQYDLINLREEICKFVNLRAQSKGSENHPGIDTISNCGEAMCSSWIIFIVLTMR